MYGLSLITGPTTLPVTLGEAKAWLRGLPKNEDALATMLVGAATELCEDHVGRQFVTATWRATFTRFPWWGWRIPKPPLQAVTSIKYYDGENSLQTLDPETYLVDTSRDPGVVSLATGYYWPMTYLRPDAVQVTFTAGYGGATEVPAGIKTAILRCVAWWSERRGDDDGEPKELPWAVKMLLDSKWSGAIEYGEIEGYPPEEDYRRQYRIRR